MEVLWKIIENYGKFIEIKKKSSSLGICPSHYLKL